jgi:hypothetical protein
MPVSGTAIASALNALRLYTRRVDQAAERIASAGLFDVTTGPPPSTDPATPPAPPQEPVDLGGAMVDMMIAQRAFAAQLRVLRTADEMLKETVEQTRAK